MFDDEPYTQTTTASESVPVVELPPSSSRALAPVVDTGVRDPITPLLPATPTGRDINRLAQVARQVGERLGLSTTPQGQSRAMYSFPAGGSRIEGPTVWLIGALWQEYGHVVVDSEVREERAGRVAITTTIVDRINGTAYRREHHTSIAPAPGKFAGKPDQVERWNTMQLQSAISKAERTTVQHFLPGWYVDVAVDAARAAFGSKVLGGKTLGEARSAALEGFEKLGVSRAQLEDWVGGEAPLWTVTDIGDLRGLYRQIKAGDLTIEGVFGGGSSKPSEPKATAGGGLDGLAAKPESKKRTKRSEASEQAEPEPKAAEAAPPAEPEPVAAQASSAAAAPPPPAGSAAPPPPRSQS